jgi:deoxyribodipyrimidine photo-lyase
VASFLCHDLGLDWRLGARYFETALVDYDVESNWGNWVAAAGLTGGRVNIFNMRKQSKQYDERGEYVRLWLPELADVPADEIHEPRPGALASVRGFK